MDNFARQAACPRDPATITHDNSFYQYFKAPETPAECQNTAQCFSSDLCYQHVIDNNLQGFASEDDAVDHASQNPRTVDAVLTFDDPELSSIDFAYTIRMNHTHMPSSRQLLNVFDILPDEQYRRYWFFTNLQQLVEQAILAVASDHPDVPNPVSINVKPFPWPAVTVDIGAAASSIAFNLLLVYSFLAPTRSTVASIVREKELRLREGMRILGLKVCYIYMDIWIYVYIWTDSDMRLCTAACLLMREFCHFTQSVFRASVYSEIQCTLLLTVLSLHTALICCCACH